MVSLFWDLKLRFGILELQNWVTKSSYTKWRHTSSYQLEYFYINSSFELLTLLRKTSNFTSSYYNSMGKLSFYHFRVSKSRLKNKTFHFELLSRSWKRKSFTSSYYPKIEIYKVPLWVTNSIGKLLFFDFRVTNWKLKNKKFYFELLIRKMKKQNLDFEDARDFFIEMKHYTIQNYLKKMKACWILWL